MKNALIILSLFFIATTSALSLFFFVSSSFGVSSPVVNTITAAATSLGTETALTLTENTTTPLYVHGTIADADGCADVATNGTVSGVFYRSNHASGDACSADNNDCYSVINANCTKTNCDGTPEDTIFNYECTAQIQYYADSTVNGSYSGSDWTAKITATDASTATGSNTDAIEMNTTVALDITPSINYGTINLGGESAEQALTTTNTGNSGIDINISADGTMTCTTGYLAPTVVHYSMTQGFAYNDGTPVYVNPAEVELNLANRTDDTTPSIKNTYLKLKLPLDNVGGDCSNTLTVAAAADTENGW